VGAERGVSEEVRTVVVVVEVSVKPCRFRKTNQHVILTYSHGPAPHAHAPSLLQVPTSSLYSVAGALDWLFFLEEKAPKTSVIQDGNI
jgi:hypothetical protein